MPIPFSIVCDLLQSLEDDRTKRTQQRGSYQMIKEWFASHRALIDRDSSSKVALLSTLLPEKRTDRVYSIQHTFLSRTFGRAQGLSVNRLQQLAAWQQSGSGIDLGGCVERILQQAPNPESGRELTVEELDGILEGIAAGNRFSSPAVRALKGRVAEKNKSEVLSRLYKRVSPRDAKWLTRLVLKSYRPVVLDEKLVCAGCHPLLPELLKVQGDFVTAMQLLEDHRSSRRVTDEPLDRSNLLQYIKPTIGIKIAQQVWLKAHSIKKLLGLGTGRMSCEDKIDGEYCQIHVDLTKSRDWIQIFSKRGRDSTRDRVGIHAAVRSALQIDEPGCRFRERCILEGELVVWSDKEQRIMEFDKIREHVTRSGVQLGVSSDFGPPAHEHLMIVFFDLLLVDDESMLAKPHSQRFARLDTLIRAAQGRAALVQRLIIDFGGRGASKEIQSVFAQCITRNEEGLVFKPDEPYFDFSSSRRRYGSNCIKLKKGYIGQLGDIGDFAVVGARYVATRAKELDMPGTKWTHFYLGCLQNRDEVAGWGEKPRFQIINIVEPAAALLKHFARYCFASPVDWVDNITIDIDLGVGDVAVPPSTVFASPPVFDVRCFSFHKDGANPFYSLRFPYVTKIHHDRDWKDCITFQRLQSAAIDVVENPLADESQELLHWIEKLEQMHPSDMLDSQKTSTTRTSLMTPSPGSSKTKSPSKSPPKLPSSLKRMQGVQSIAHAMLPTPPPSSAVTGASKATKAAADYNEPRLHLKRGADGRGSLVVKKGRSEREPVETPPASDRATQGEPRQPLGEIISQNASQTNLQPAQAKAAASSPHATNAKAAASSGAKPAQNVSRNVPQVQPELSVAHCSVNVWVDLSFHAVLLSPCVAGITLLREDLLPYLGCETHYLDFDPFRRHRRAAQPGANVKQSERVLQRLIFVEAARKDATKVFLTEITAKYAEYAKKRGLPTTQKMQARIYDWRLVEKLATARLENRTLRYKEDVVKALWDKYFVGII